MSYSNDVASPEVEIAGEAAGSSFFADAKSKYADLRAMLDSNKDNLKMEAMKRIINMIAKGKDASELFPAVVKNVAVKNVEVKKLVYVYLMRYAEEQQDLALLSISTFQRALKDPNQLIRASALRVLSSIRVQMIVPIMMLSIKESMRDMSPYVRKVAAHAIPKLYSLDPDHKDQLMEVIDHLLADRTTLVIGSAVYAFEEVCPEREDLIHKHYRKLCQLLVDVDEWGQVIIINALTRYARSQFTDPNQGKDDSAGANKKEEKFYSSSEEGSDEDDGKNGEDNEKNEKPYVMDPDLRMLLKNTKSLLQSRNTAVVLAVSQLYYHLAPKEEVGIIAKALIRLLRGHREVQSIVLTNIATISANRRSMFEPYLKSFFVRSSDPTHIKLLKLDILTNLATQTNISIILREFQTYVQTHDKEFAAATIDAIGRCACNIKEVTDVCLSGLVNLMSNKNEIVVAQSVVVIKKLLQLQPSHHHDIISSMAKLIDTVKVSAARASILWLIGEYCQVVPRIAPDVLRKMAKTFVHEEEMVKLQVLNLAVKLYLTNFEQTQLLVQYVFTLARYDQSYDLRDRARFLRNLVMPQKASKLSKFAKDIFLSSKPAPIIESTFKDRDHFQLGTLSHYLNQRCAGYRDLPEFPPEAPDSSVRDVEGWGIPTQADMAKAGTGGRAGGLLEGSTTTTGTGKKRPTEKFYSDEEEEDDEEKEEESSEEEGEESSEEESEVEEEEKSEDEEEEEDEEKESEDEDEKEESEDEEESSEDERDKVEVIKKAPTKPQHKPKAEPKSGKQSKAAAKSATDLLLDLDFDIPAISSVPNPSYGGGPIAPTMAAAIAGITPAAPAIIPTGSWNTAPAQFIPTSTKPLLNRLSGHGLVIDYRFARSPSLFSSKMCSIELIMGNQSKDVIKNVRLGEKKFHHGMDLQGSVSFDTLSPNQTVSTTIGIDFADTTQSIAFDILANDHKHALSIVAPVGEQLQPIAITTDQFKMLQQKLSGMNETSGKIKLSKSIADMVNDRKMIAARVFEEANVIEVPSSEEKLCFAGQTMSSKAPLLVSMAKTHTDEVKLSVNCEKMVIGSMLFKQLKSKLSAD